MFKTISPLSIIFKSYIRSYAKWADHFNDIIVKNAHEESKQEEILFYMNQY